MKKTISVEELDETAQKRAKVISQLFKVTVLLFKKSKVGKFSTSEKATIKKDAVERASREMGEPSDPEKSRSLEEVRESCSRIGFSLFELKFCLHRHDI